MPTPFTTKRFTADEYQRMGQVGILSQDDRVELIDGQVVAMTPIGMRHNACVSRATRALVFAAGEDAIVLPQGSVRLGSYHEPEPDLALLRPRADFYASRMAGPADILLIIEIADSSLEYDRDVKARIYATASVRMTSSAARLPATPASAPRIPASEHAGTVPAGGASGNKQR
jgi:Uma2 family endonuclease